MPLILRFKYLGRMKLAECRMWKRLDQRGQCLAQGMRFAIEGPEDGWYLADDSGLEVDGLDGRPGVISARYAGEPCDDEANNDKVLEEMRGKPSGSRTCRFRCVLALVGKGVESTFSGSCEGTLLRNEGEPVALAMIQLFLPDESASTFAEISMAEKAKISHRARALIQLIEWLKQVPSS